MTFGAAAPLDTPFQGYSGCEPRNSYYNPKGADRLGIVYIANLNIEYTYKQKMGRYEPFDHIVFVDTLDNMGFKYEAKQLDFFHSYDFREYKERVIDLLGRVCTVSVETRRIVEAMDDKKKVVDS